MQDDIRYTRNRGYVDDLKPMVSRLVATWSITGQLVMDLLHNCWIGFSEVSAL